MSHSQHICLFGGTFDPIHLGHTYIALQAIKELNIDKMIFLPCRQSPHKVGKKCAPESARFEMCKLATEALPWAEVSNHDLIAEAPSYSWKTAEHFKNVYPNAQLYWLMGTDQWNSLHKWARCEHFTQLIIPIVFTRGNEPLIKHGFVEKMHTITGNHPASATAIRKWIKSNKAQSAPWIDPSLQKLIKAQDLY